MTWKPKPSSVGDLTSLCKATARKLKRILDEEPALVIVFQTESEKRDGTNCHWVSNHASREDTIKQLRAVADEMEATLN